MDALCAAIRLSVASCTPSIQPMPSMRPMRTLRAVHAQGAPFQLPLQMQTCPLWPSHEVRFPCLQHHMHLHTRRMESGCAAGGGGWCGNAIGTWARMRLTTPQILQPASILPRPARLTTKHRVPPLVCAAPHSPMQPHPASNTPMQPCTITRCCRCLCCCRCLFEGHLHGLLVLLKGTPQLQLTHTLQPFAPIQSHLGGGNR